MTTALTILAIAAAMWIGISLGIALAIVWSARHDQVWEDERPEWADDPTPTYDALCFEFWEREVSK